MQKIGVFTPHFEGLRRDIYNLFTEIDLAGEICAMGHHQDLKMRSCPLPRKIIPHLIGQKMGKIHPSPRIVYVLFTKADFANKKMRLSAHIKEGWALYARPIELLIFVLAQWQKEGFSHQLHSEPEAVGKGVALGDAVHLVHVLLELFKSFFLLVRERAVKFLSISGDQLQ